MRVLVTGGAGFLGSHLCRRLAFLEHEVIPLDDLSTGRHSNLPPVIRHRTILSRAADIGDLSSFDLVYHLASSASPKAYMMDPVGCLDANTTGTANILRLAAVGRTRVVLASTAEVYDMDAPAPQAETTRCVVDPSNPYVVGKLALEAYAQAYRSQGLSVATARLFNTYGPGLRPDDGRLIPTLLECQRRGEALPVFGDGSQLQSYCWVGDMVDALVELGESDFSGVMNLGDPRAHSVLNIAKLISDNVDLKGGTPRRLPNRCPDISLALEKLNWVPRVSLEDGLRRLMGRVD